jgi:ankyrin repeat protein
MNRFITSVLTVFVTMFVVHQAFAVTCTGTIFELHDDQTGLSSTENAMLAIEKNIEELQHDLVMAAKKCSISEVEKLLSKGADINGKANDNTAFETYPIFKAVKNCGVDFYKFMVAKGANVNISRPDLSAVPVMIAVRNFRNGVSLEMISDPKVNINKGNSDNRGVIHTASFHSNELVLDALLKRSDLDLNKKTLWGKTALSIAVNYSPKSFDKIINHGNNVKRMSAFTIKKALKKATRRLDYLSGVQGEERDEAAIKIKQQQIKKLKSY